MASYGYAPYEEAAAKGNLRSTLARLALGFGAGLSAQAAGPDPLSQFGAGLYGSSRALMLQDQAALNYAQRQVQMRRQQEEDESQRQLREAQIERAKRPEKLPEPFGKPPWYLSPEWIDTPQGKAAQAKAVRVSQGKGPKPPKSVKTRADEQIEIARQKKLAKENYALQAADDPAELLQVSQDMKLEPETRKGAWAKYLRLSQPTNLRQVE